MPALRHGAGEPVPRPDGKLGLIQEPPSRCSRVSLWFTLRTHETENALKRKTTFYKQLGNRDPHFPVEPHS